MRVTPLDIEQHRFKVRFRGFDRKEVAFFLELISNEMEDLIGENNALKEDLREKEDILNAYKEREKHISESIVASQKIAEDMKLNAQKEAGLIISEAEIKSEKIIEKANQELANIRNGILDLKKQRMQFDSAMRSLIETHLKMLDIEREEIEKDG